MLFLHGHEHYGLSVAEFVKYFLKKPKLIMTSESNLL